MVPPVLENTGRKEGSSQRVEKKLGEVHTDPSRRGTAGMSASIVQCI